jgi:membrane protease YdiL (CAAX protease family)
MITSIKLKEANSLQLFFLSLVAMIINGYLFNYIEGIYKPVFNDAFSATDSKLFVFVMACIAGPIVETYLTQALPHQIFQKLGITNFYVLLIVPALCFGLLHGTHPIILLNKTIGGLILNYLYLDLRAKNKNAFINVAAVHGLYNLYGFLFVAAF